MQNKLSEKLGRRGIKFYDLYMHHKEEKDARMLSWGVGQSENKLGCAEYHTPNAQGPHGDKRNR
jgi:hypothetical protein